MKEEQRSMNKKISCFFIATIMTLMIFIIPVYAADVYYKITYDYNGGIFEGATSNVQSYNSTKYAESDYSTGTSKREPLKDGYSFLGWKFFIDGVEQTKLIPKGETYLIKPGTVGPFIFKAQWEPILNWDLKGGEWSEQVNKEAIPNTYTEGESYTPDGNFKPVKVGYSFAGWNPAVIDELKTGPQTITAKWVLVYYKIMYDLAGGDNGRTDNLQSYNIEGATPYTVPDFRIPSKVGHSYTGWKLYSAKNSGERIDEIGIDTIPTDFIGHVIFVAQWKPNVYGIKWNCDGGSRGGNLEADYPDQYTYGVGLSFDEVPIPTKAGFTFAGWSPTSITTTMKPDDPTTPF